MLRTSILLLLLASAGCPKKSDPATSTTTPGGTEMPAGDAMLTAGNMAEAPAHDVPKTLEIVKPSCNQASYLKVKVDAGKPFTVDVKTSAGCAAVAVLNQNGGSAGDNTSIEACADAPKSISSAGQEGATFISVTETGACAGNTVTIDIK